VTRRAKKVGSDPKCGQHRPQRVAGKWAIHPSKPNVTSPLRCVQHHKWQVELQISINSQRAQTREKSVISLTPRPLYSQRKNLSYTLLKTWVMSSACLQVLGKLRLFPPFWNQMMICQSFSPLTSHYANPAIRLLWLQ
jgi:hypothetical protein